GEHMGEGAGQVRIRMKIILPMDRPQVGGLEVPAHPVGGAVRIMVTEDILKFCKVRWMAYSGGCPSAHATLSGPYGGCLYASHCGLSDHRAGSIDDLWRCVSHRSGPLSFC